MPKMGVDIFEDSCGPIPKKRDLTLWSWYKEDWKSILLKETEKVNDSIARTTVNVWLQTVTKQQLNYLLDLSFWCPVICICCPNHLPRSGVKTRARREQQAKLLLENLEKRGWQWHFCSDSFGSFCWSARFCSKMDFHDFSSSIVYIVPDSFCKADSASLIFSDLIK